MAVDYQIRCGYSQRIEDTGTMPSIADAIEYSVHWVAGQWFVGEFNLELLPNNGQQFRKISLTRLYDCIMVDEIFCETRTTYTLNGQPLKVEILENFALIV